MKPQNSRQTLKTQVIRAPVRYRAYTPKEHVHCYRMTQTNNITPMSKAVTGIKADYLRCKPETQELLQWKEIQNVVIFSTLLEGLA